MLELTVTLKEGVDDDNNFVVLESFDLELEHSLAALSKWESKLEKPFLAQKEKTTEDTLFYIECMTLTPNVPPEVFSKLVNEHYKAIMEYIDSKQTATWFSDRQPQTQGKEIVTAEIIYFWMVSLQIPWEAQYWHLNKLLTLIRVFELKGAKQKPMGKAEQMQRQREENARRRAMYKTKG